MFVAVPYRLARTVSPIEAAALRAPCERSAVERCGITFDGTGDLGSSMPILSVRVRWGRPIDWVCKPEVTGSIPVRSINPCKSALFVVSMGESEILLHVDRAA